MKISDELIAEQKKIIESENKLVVVSAGPGSGKTYTIIKRVVRELKEYESLNINKGIILCSFTREASLELERKLKKEINNNFSYVGTIDSFILTEIISPYKNRIMKKVFNKITNLQKFKVKIPPLNKNLEVNILTRVGLNDYNKDRIINYYNNWIEELTLGNYEVSFPSYMLAVKALSKVSELKNYIKNTYTAIYIDESQDLNYFQNCFIEKLINICEINCYLIGDKRQSIYGFRGAKPEMFYLMINKGFTEMKITHSARCHFNVLEFARNIIGEGIKKKLKNEGRVLINKPINYKTLNIISKDYLILVESNDEAKEIYDNCLENNIQNIIYTRKININVDKNFSDNFYDLIEELIIYYLNYNNPNPKYSYSIEDLSYFLSDLIEEKYINTKYINPEKFNNFGSFLKNIMALGTIQVSDSITYELNNQLSDNSVYYHYFKTDGLNRIMTIHSSKGLEATYVFVQLIRKSFNVDEELKRKLFVAFTRAKERLIIGFTGDAKSPVEKLVIDTYNNLFIHQLIRITK